LPSLAWGGSDGRVEQRSFRLAAPICERVRAQLGRRPHSRRRPSRGALITDLDHALAAGQPQLCIDGHRLSGLEHDSEVQLLATAARFSQRRPSGGAQPTVHGVRTHRRPAETSGTSAGAFAMQKFDAKSLNDTLGVLSPRAHLRGGMGRHRRGRPVAKLKAQQEHPVERTPSSRLDRKRPHRDSNCTEAVNDNPATTHAKAEFARESEAVNGQERLDRS
jgi:hypothetical protein